MNPKVKKLRRELHRLQLQGESNLIAEQRRNRRIEELRSRMDRAARTEKMAYNPPPVVRSDNMRELRRRVKEAFLHLSPAFS